MTLIILEGPRGVGKTTISHALTQRLRQVTDEVSVWKVQRGEDPIADQLHAIAYDFSKALRLYSCIVIVDRFHTTEYVMTEYYGRRKDGGAFKDFEMVDRLLKLTGAIGFNLMIDSQTLLRRVLERSDGRGFDMSIDESLKRWNYAIGKSYFTTLQNNAIDETIEKIFEIWKGWTGQ